MTSQFIALILLNALVTQRVGHDSVTEKMTKLILI